MTPMPKDIPWRIQLEDIINIEKDAFLNTYRMEKGGQVLNYFIRDNGTMSTFSVYSTDYSSAESLPYIYTEKGLKLQSPYNVNGVKSSTSNGIKSSGYLFVPMQMQRILY